jgi:hypothetical protein
MVKIGKFFTNMLALYFYTILILLLVPWYAYQSVKEEET